MLAGEFYQISGQLNGYFILVLSSREIGYFNTQGILKSQSGL